MSDYFGTYEYESGMLRHGKPMDGDGGVFYLPHQCDEWEIGGVDPQDPSQAVARLAIRVNDTQERS